MEKDILLKLKVIAKEVLENHKVISIDIDQIDPGFVDITLVNRNRIRGSYESVAREVIRRALKCAILKYVALKNKSFVHEYRRNARVQLYQKLFEKHTDLVFGLRTQFDLIYPLFLSKMIRIYLSPQESKFFFLFLFCNQSVLVNLKASHLNCCI